MSQYRQTRRDEVDSYERGKRGEGRRGRREGRRVGRREGEQKGESTHGDRQQVIERGWVEVEEGIEGIFVRGKKYKIKKIKGGKIMS